MSRFATAPWGFRSQSLWHKLPIRGILSSWMPHWCWVSKGDWSSRQRFAAL